MVVTCTGKHILVCLFVGLLETLSKFFESSFVFGSCGYVGIVY